MCGINTSRMTRNESSTGNEGKGNNPLRPKESARPPVTFFTCLLKNAPADAIDLDSEDECAELFGSTQEQYHGPTQEPAGGLAVVSRRR